MKKKRCLSVVIISLLLGISCFIMAGCANKDNEDKDDTKIEQNLIGTSPCAALLQQSTLSV